MSAPHTPPQSPAPQTPPAPAPPPEGDPYDAFPDWPLRLVAEGVSEEVFEATIRALPDVPITIEDGPDVVIAPLVLYLLTVRGGDVLYLAYSAIAFLLGDRPSATREHIAELLQRSSGFTWRVLKTLERLGLVRSVSRGEGNRELTYQAVRYLAPEVVTLLRRLPDPAIVIDIPRSTVTVDGVVQDFTPPPGPFTASKWAEWARDVGARRGPRDVRGDTYRALDVSGGTYRAPDVRGDTYLRGDTYRAPNVPGGTSSSPKSTPTSRQNDRIQAGAGAITDVSRSAARGSNQRAENLDLFVNPSKSIEGISLPIYHSSTSTGTKNGTSTDIYRARKSSAPDPVAPTTSATSDAGLNAPDQPDAPKRRRGRPAFVWSDVTRAQLATEEPDVLAAWTYYQQVLYPNRRQPSTDDLARFRRCLTQYGGTLEDICAIIDWAKQDPWTNGTDPNNRSSRRYDSTANLFNSADKFLRYLDTAQNLKRRGRKDARGNDMSLSAANPNPTEYEFS